MKLQPAISQPLVWTGALVIGLLLASSGSVAADSVSAVSFPGSASDWHGYKRYDFHIGSHPVTIVAPAIALAGRPWVWHGEFFGHRPEPDIRLLSRGFHIAYVSIPDQLGSPHAVRTWNECYAQFTDHYGLARRVALVGLSRGALYCYNWASANPNHVACIYADAPVCDLKSWPGGKGKGQGSPRDWQLALECYGFQTETEAMAYQGNPVDRLQPLAAAGVPLLHVYGDADPVVPWEENTKVVAERYQALGGKITLISKPGVAHHPHGLEDPTPIVEFIARHSPGTPQEFVDAVRHPIWNQPLRPEPLFFLQLDANERPSARLLYPATQVQQVTNGTRDVVYEADRDYRLSDDRLSISLPTGSRIPFKTFDDLFPLKSSTVPQIARQSGDDTRGIYFDNGSGYHRWQAQVTYTSEMPTWPAPAVAESVLPRTRAKLRAAEPVKLVVCGDSISEGYNASKFTQAPPYCAAYGELVALALEQTCGSPVDYRNVAVGGWSTDQGLSHLRTVRLGQERPDVVIIAFGMNDVFRRDAAQFGANVRAMIRALQDDSPDTECVLIASMLGNRDWGIPIEQFSLYRTELLSLADQQTVVVDMQAVWEELLRRKSYYDLAGNGVNHPNDFGHQLYAQFVLAQLLPPDAGR